MSKKKENWISIPTNLLLNSNSLDEKISFDEKIKTYVIKSIKKINICQLSIINYIPKIVLKEKHIEISIDYNYSIEFIDDEEIDRLITRQGKVLKTISFGLEDINNKIQLSHKTIKVVIEDAQLKDIDFYTQEKRTLIEGSLKVNARLIMY